ncbi:MAG TPA: carbamoyltransferase C-terminal domain-containing protein [Streptosporangiaceae bacterium]|nr:carbamoyltransferase C-terminal domain-containing protein [Streptosporangiaceae bacterium]
MTAPHGRGGRPAAHTRVILSVNFNHDGAAVLLLDGRMAGFVCTERFSRKKKHPGLREEDLDELLGQAGVVLGEIDHVMLCNLHNMDSPDIPYLHGSSLKETWFEFWVNQRNDTVLIRGQEIPCTVNPDHHLLHAATPYYTSPFDSGASLAIDPTGCRAFLGKAHRLYPLPRGYDDWFNANIGYTYAAGEMFGSSIVGAGKLMGLAPFGKPEQDHNFDWKAISTFAEVMELASRDPVYVQSNGRSLNATLAYYVQLGLELQLSAVLADLADVSSRNGGGLNLCLSGGTALNAIANQLCFERSEFKRLHLHPACGDDGTAIGAALWYWHHVLGHPRQPYDNAELMYSVHTYTDRDVTAALDAAMAANPGRLTVDRTDDYVRVTAQLLAGGAIVGWFDGAAEIGPRALGHRSILADPRDPHMKDKINSRVKFREHFRPLAPAVLSNRSAEWFGLTDSPFMLRACPVLRDEVPAITHIDGTSRIQTVTAADNPAFHRLIESFDSLTGVPLVLNTSLNTKGLPIDETPEHAIDTLLTTRLDHLVFPGAIVSKAGPEPAPAREDAR